MNASDDAWERVAKAIARRRIELKFDSIEALARSVNMDPETFSNMENRRRTRYRVSTLRKMSEALQWEPEHIIDMLRSAAPSLEHRVEIAEQLLSDAHLTISRLDGRNDELARTVERLAEQVRQLSERLERMFPPPER